MRWRDRGIEGWRAGEGQNFPCRCDAVFFLHPSLFNPSPSVMGAFIDLTFSKVEWKTNAAWRFRRGLSNPDAYRAVDVCLNIEIG